MIASLFLFLFFQVAQPTPTPTAPEPRKTPSATTTTAQEKEQEPAIRKHSIRIGNQTLNYTTTAGFIPIRNPQTGEVEARMFFMAYTLDGVQDVSKRPLTFSFNGGPGSSSVWLHLGALGPKRVKMLDDGFMPPPPYEL
ncbi:MAG: S10 family serine carboxypeptidase-like protein, partial [Pyrinomonadaceae bacterium]